MSNLLCSVRAFERKMSGRRIFERPKNLTKEQKAKIYNDLSVVSRAFERGESIPSLGINFTNLKKLGFNDQGTFVELWKKYTKQPDFDPGTFAITNREIRKFKIGVSAWAERIGKPRSDFAKRWHIPKEMMRNIPELSKFERDLTNQSSFFRRYNVKTNKAINEILVDFQDLAGSLEPNVAKKVSTKLGLTSKSKDLSELQNNWQSVFQQMVLTSDPVKLSKLKKNMKDIDGQIIKLFESNSGRAFELINQLFQGVDPETMTVESNGVRVPLNRAQKSKLKNMAKLNQVVRAESVVTLVRGLEKIETMAKGKNLVWANEYVDKIKSYIKQIEFQSVIDKNNKTIDQKFWTSEKTLFKLGFKPEESLMVGTIGKDAKMAFSPQYMTQFTLELLPTINRLREHVESSKLSIDKELKAEVDGWDRIIGEIKNKSVTLNKVYSKDPYFFLRKYSNDVGMFNYKTHLKASFSKALNDLNDFHLKPARASKDKQLEDSAMDMMEILKDVYQEINTKDPTKDRFAQDMMRAMTSYTYFRLMGGNLRSAARNGSQRLYELKEFGIKAYFEGRAFYSKSALAEQNKTKLNKWLEHYGLQWHNGKSIIGGALDGIKDMNPFSRKKSKQYANEQLSEQSRGALEDAYSTDGSLYVNAKGELTIIGDKSIVGKVADVSSAVAKKTGFAHRVVEDWNRGRTFKTAFALAHMNLEQTPDNYLARKVLGYEKVAEIKKQKGDGYEVTIEDLRSIHGDKTRKVINEYIESTAAQTAYNATMDLHFEYAKWNKARIINPKDTDTAIVKFAKAGLGQFSHYKFSMMNMMYKWIRDAGISVSARDFRSEEMIRMMRFGLIQSMILGVSIPARTNLAKLFSNDVLQDLEIAGTWLEMNRQKLFSGDSSDIEERFMDITYDQGLGYFAGPNYQIGKKAMDAIFTAVGANEIAEFYGSHEDPTKMQVFDKAAEQAVRTSKNQETYEKWYWINSMLARQLSYGGDMWTEAGGFIDWLRLELGLFPSKEQRKLANSFYEMTGLRKKKKSRRKKVKKNMGVWERRRAIEALSKFGN